MRDSKINSKVNQKMAELDALEEISPSDFWQESLLNRLAELDRGPKKLFYTNKMSIVVIASIIINLGFIYKIASHKYESQNSRVDNLQLISNEFFINPISLKN